MQQQWKKGEIIFLYEALLAHFFYFKLNNFVFSNEFYT